MSNRDSISATLEVPRIAVILVTLGLVLLGLVMVYSSSMVKAINNNADPNSYLVKQALFAGIGMAALVVAYKFRPLDVLKTRRGILAVALVCWGLLIATALLGTGDEEWGAQRWIDLRLFSLQPSEFIKIGLVAVAAYLYQEYREGGLNLTQFVVFGVVFVLAPMAFLFKAQSDLGTTLVLAMGVLSVAWIGGAKKIVIAGILVVALVLVIFAIFGESYRATRMAIFLDPWSDGKNGQGDGWQTIHSFWAFSEGGIFGLGLGNSYEKYSYLPMAETDFIFAIIGEELGMIGALLVMAAFVVLLVSGLHIAYQNADPFDTMFAGSLAVMLSFQAFLNMGCALGAFPTTGKPLPFISAGGSSMIASLFMVGFILRAVDNAAQFTEHDRRREDLRVVHAVDRQSSAPSGFVAQRTNKNIPFASGDSSFVRQRRPENTSRRR